MADQPEPKRETKPVKIIDFGKPFYLTVRQAPTRNVIDVFTGPKAKDEAEAHATEQATATKTHVAVLGPQVAVFAPPVPAVATLIELDWQAGRPAQA